MNTETKKPSTSPLILSNLDVDSEKISEWIGEQFKGRPFVIVCVKGWKMPQTRAFDCEESFSKALILFEGLPIQPNVVQDWRDWAKRRNVKDVRMAIIRNQINQETFSAALKEHCADWDASIPERESPAIRKGEFVKMPDHPTPKDDSSLLTMMFGSMGELLSQLEIAASKFKGACEQAEFDKTKIQKLLGESQKKLSVKKPKDYDMKTPFTGLEELIDHFPKILLHGESGVGKTLIAAYLQSRTGLVEGRPRRIPIPEYLGKEDSFEYDMFGYAKGSYTGGKEDGDPGLLLSHMGGVIFLDEIGEANAAIQAKLLAFLDDYRVRPRGWSGEPFHCPVLILAATNRDLDAMEADGSFRGDLLSRFTDRLTVPPLRERMQDIEFILDCLLQRPSLNPEGAITEIGSEALQKIRERQFAKGNFREMEDWFRKTCDRAAREGRNYIVSSDVDSEQ